MEQGKVRIISGTLGGRIVRFPGNAPIRPTSARVRESLFSALGSRLSFEGLRVLDLFAGSGAFGIEALSRGAAESVFVERHPSLAAALQRNLVSLGIHSGTKVIATDVLAWLKRENGGKPFDLVFCDPPYEEGFSEQIPGFLVSGRWLAPESRLFLECGKREQPHRGVAAAFLPEPEIEKVTGDTRMLLFHFGAETVFPATAPLQTMPANVQAIPGKDRAIQAKERGEGAAGDGTGKDESE